MNRIQSKGNGTLQPFEVGQIWELKDSNLHIGLVGKTLVHYKHYRNELKRAPVSLANKTTLAKFLRANRAVLVRQKRGRPSSAA
ncbi:MAG: hypothetical protein HY300_19085 [Verrucomicrobia bacterium]|nr:hypothetical protein [Verrucomicrobiota bacterium]